MDYFLDTLLYLLCSCFSCQRCVNFVLLDILGLRKLAPCAVQQLHFIQKRFSTVSGFIKQKLVSPKDF